MIVIERLLYQSIQVLFTSYTETDPSRCNCDSKADGAGNIDAAVAGTDYLASVAFSDLTSTFTNYCMA